MIDYRELAESIAEMREAFAAMVAGLVEDGFTDEQARVLIVTMMTREVEYE